ncbi:MAG: chromosome segregation protein SMC, partial [Clostridia bacterium]|nr:chromosome segregation protein SMC [Clostridia bacterium]
MLMDTGMGRDGYSIIGQGKIDQILYANPDDRRSMFEEASGISKYKYRKAEATRKLEKTNDNLIRIMDIVSELETQIGPLKEQSEKAQKFLVLSEELKELEVTAYVNSIEKNKAAYDKAKVNYDDIEKEFNEAKAESEANEKAIEEYYEEKKLFDSSLEEIKNQASEILVEIARKESDIALKKSAIENINENIKRLNEEIKTLREQNEAGSVERAEEAVYKAKEKKDTLMRELNALPIIELREEVDSLSAKTAKKASEIDVLSVQIEGRIGRLESFDVIADEQSKRLNALATEEKELAGEVETHKAELLGLEKNKSECEEKSRGYDEQKKNMNQEFSDLTSANEELKTEYNKESTELQEIVSRLRFLEELERDMDGYSGAVKSIVENKSLKGIKGVLSELIHVEAKYIPAIEASLGGSMQNIVTETDKDSREAIDYLKSKGRGRATFLPLNIIKERSLDKMNHPGYLGPVSDFVSCDAEIRPAVLNLLGNVALCDTFENAISLFKKQNGKIKIVTLSGEYINSGGAVTGGSMSKIRGLLSRKQEIATLEGSCAKQKEKVKAAESAIDKNDRLIEKLRKSASELTEQIEKNKEVYADVSSKVEIRKNILLKEEERLAELRDAKSELVYGLENRDKAKEELKQSIEDAERQLEEEKKALKVISEQLECKKQELEALNQARIDKTMEINNASKDIEMYFNALEAARNGADSRRELAEAKALEIARLENEIARITGEIELVHLSISELKKVHKAKGEELEAKKDEFSKRDQNTSRLRENNKIIQEKVISLAQEMTKLSGKIEALEHIIEEEIGKLWEEYELTFSEAVKERDAKGSKTGSSTLINKLKREIKELGTINVAAIEDYKNVSERYEFLSEQKKDMLETKDNLERIIEDMQKIMSVQFTEQFEKINNDFKETYIALTGGGTANISLADPSDVLESGIDIELQPPGKKLQNIMLLSGGEKAIAAIALFFAMLSVRPTPFCVLDEIEAALDESNVQRFASFLRNYSKTQFLVITHRRGTMESADMLYGVTMQEKGITKLLSLKLSEVDQN